MQELEKQLYDLKSQIVDLKLKIKKEAFLKSKLKLKNELIILQKKRKNIYSKIYRLKYSYRYHEDNVSKKRREYLKNYYLKNPEKFQKIKKKSIKFVRDWQKKNKEKVKLYAKSYYERKKLKSLNK
jgi:hypothetical protein